MQNGSAPCGASSPDNDLYLFYHFGGEVGYVGEFLLDDFLSFPSVLAYEDGGF